MNRLEGGVKVGVSSPSFVAKCHRHLSDNIHTLREERDELRDDQKRLELNGTSPEAMCAFHARLDKLTRRHGFLTRRQIKFIRRYGLPIGTGWDDNRPDVMDSQTAHRYEAEVCKCKRYIEQHKHLRDPYHEDMVNWHQERLDEAEQVLAAAAGRDERLDVL